MSRTSERKGGPFVPKPRRPGHLPAKLANCFPRPIKTALPDHTVEKSV